MPRFYRVKGSGKHHIGEYRPSLNNPYNDEGGGGAGDTKVLCKHADIQTTATGEVDLSKRTFVFNGLINDNRDWCQTCTKLYVERLFDSVSNDILIDVAVSKVEDLFFSERQ